MGERRTANFGVLEYGAIFLGRDIDRDLEDLMKMARDNQRILTNKRIVIMDRRQPAVKKGVKIWTEGEYY